MTDMFYYIPKTFICQAFFQIFSKYFSEYFWNRKKVLGCGSAQKNTAAVAAGERVH
jgi:hypothetical protein